MSWHSASGRITRLVGSRPNRFYSLVGAQANCGIRQKDVTYGDRTYKTDAERL